MLRRRRLDGDHQRTDRDDHDTGGDDHRGGDDHAASTITTEPAADGAIAEQVDLDGRSIYLECRGTGSPTVVLQSGYGNAGDIWSLTDTTAPAVFPTLAETNRVCIYDRPGSTITIDDASGTLDPRRHDSARAAAALCRRPPVTPPRW